MKIQLVCLVILASHPDAFAQAAPQGAQLKPVYENGRWGYVDRGGREGIPMQFLAADDFAEGLAAVKIIGGDGRCVWGYIDRAGGFANTPRFREAQPFAGGLAGL